MKRNMTEWVDGLLASPERMALPIVTYPGADLTGAKIMDLISNGQVQFECVQALCAKYPSAAAITIMDLSAEAETFGSPVKFSDHEAPTVTAPIIKGMEGIRALPRARPGLKRTMAYLEAARLCAKHITDRPTFGGVIGPFSLAGRLFDVTQIMVEVRRHPKMVHMLLSKCTEYILEYIRAFKTVGAHGVVMAEPTAGLLSPAMSKTFAYNYIRYMVDQVQDENFIVVLHNCGPATKQVSGMLGTNSRVLHFGNAVDMLDILPQVPPHVVACGNIDPSNVMRMGTPRLVREKVSELLFRTYTHRNFMLSTGCDVPPGTPQGNLEAFYATLADYNRTRGNT
ncbi:MAG: methylcobamide--CoM methyltransferase [Holophagaceae bacterium]|nr:methylcobamide--CoM methyltransferase [Holophagaceae bacterium]